MVKTANITNFSIDKGPLLKTIDKKITSAKVNNINELLNSKLKVELDTIIQLLEGIEIKFRKCEMIYIAYFENIDHDVLVGNSASLPYVMECVFMESTTFLRYNYECNDKRLYKELIDMNFQNFILSISSVYENLVTLSEILLRKIIIHTKGKAPLSAPLHDFISFLKTLISLGYRQDDELNKCVMAFDSYFQQYLSTINQLRNSFVHGYSINLKADGYNYRITTFSQSAFSPNSPLLHVDNFTKVVLHNTKSFIQLLYPALEKTMRHYTKSVPA